MKSLALCLALCACSGRAYSPDDWTRCGAVAAGDFATKEPTWLTGAVLRDAEDALLRALAVHTPISTASACAHLSGLRVYSHPLTCWRDAYERDVCGVALCGEMVAQVGTPIGGDWRFSALAHELAHVVRGCEALGPIDEGMDRMHADWRRMGINAALVAVQEGT